MINLFPPLLFCFHKVWQFSRFSQCQHMDTDINGIWVFRNFFSSLLLFDFYLFNFSIIFVKEHALTQYLVLFEIHCIQNTENRKRKKCHEWVSFVAWWWISKQLFNWKQLKHWFGSGNTYGWEHQERFYIFTIINSFCMPTHPLPTISITLFHNSAYNIRKYNIFSIHIQLTNECLCTRVWVYLFAISKKG